MSRLLYSLKLQITLAIALLTLLFAGSTLYSLHVIDRQHSDNALVQLARQLQFNQQHLNVQAMRYQENAPRNYPAYHRDLRLYFEDMKKTRDELTKTIEAFARGRFDQSLTGEPMTAPARLPRQSQLAARELAAAWQSFLVQLDERIGPDPKAPRLEWAAQWIVENLPPLQAIAEKLQANLEHDVKSRAARAKLVSRLLLLAALLVAIGIAAWFHHRVLRPLSRAVEGFKQVASGDLAYRVPITHNNEIGALADSFNRLSERMGAVRKLLTGLEQGTDLDGTLRILSETLPPLMPVDWIGVLVLEGDGKIHLEKAYSDGRPDDVGELSFAPDQSLLEECIRNREPLHIADVREMAALSDTYLFLKRLVELGRRDAVFLPIENVAGLHGVAVFASRFPGNFRSEHLALLHNLGSLVGVSLGRTIKAPRYGRRAGDNASRAHLAQQVEEQLTTLGDALRHLKQLPGLPSELDRELQAANQAHARLAQLSAEVPASQATAESS